MKQDKEDSVKEEREFNFCIARYWNSEGGQLAVYTYGSQVHYGTMGSALELLSHVCAKQPSSEYFICEVVPESQLAAQSEQIRQLQEEVDYWKGLKEEWDERAWRSLKKCSELESLLSSEKERHGQTFDAGVTRGIWEMVRNTCTPPPDKSTYLSSLTQTDVKTEK
jgi:hypothetical protein